MKNLLTLFLLAAAFVSAAATPRNIILFIGDGMSTPQRMTAEEFSRKSGRGSMAMNALSYQANTRTCSASAMITDSAAAATAIACGVKTYNEALGVDPRTNAVVSVAELAKRCGKKVGIVTTVIINHATPGGFYAHRSLRSDYYGVGLDLLSSGFDYFAGGGLKKHDDRRHREYRGDLYELAAKAGYRFINCDRAAFDALKPGVGKAWFVGAKEHYPYTIDASSWWQGQPTLAELTAKGLELLGDAEKGFFMMVEGGSVDWACHANDAATNLRELLALDDAVRVAVDFQRTHPDTLVIVTGDHETGGMSMGFAKSSYSFKVEKLVGQHCSTDFARAYLRQNQPTEFAQFRPFIERNFQFDFTADEWRQMEAAFVQDLERVRQQGEGTEVYNKQKVRRLPSLIVALVAHKCGIGWSSSAHTALPTLTTAQGPGAEAFHGFLENTDIARILKSYLP